MAKKKELWPKVINHRDKTTNEPIMRETQYKDGEKTYLDLRPRPDFTYEDLLKASTNPAIIKFVFEDENGNRLFEQTEDIVVLGQTRKNYRLKPVQGKTLLEKLAALENHCTFADVEAAKGTRKSVPLQMAVGWVNYNFHLDSTVVAAQTIGLTNKWHDQFIKEGLGFIKANTGVDISMWFASAGLRDSEDKLSKCYYLNYPTEHPEHRDMNKMIIFKAHNAPNKWTNMNPQFTDGKIWLVVQEEPVRIKVSAADPEPLSYEVIEANEDIVLNNVSRHCFDHGFPFIVVSAFNANDPLNKRIKRNLKLHPVKVDWMKEDPLNNHTSLSYHPDQKNGNGLKILRQSKLSANINELARNALANRIKKGQLTPAEEMTVLGVPLSLPDPSKVKTYTDTPDRSKLLKEFDKSGKEIIYLHSGMDFDFNRESRFHVSIMYGETETGKIKRFHYHKTTPESWMELGEYQRVTKYGQWFEETVEEFLAMSKELKPTSVPILFGDDDGRTNLRLALKIPTFNNWYTTQKVMWHPYLKQYGKAKRFEDTELSGILFHADIRNRTMFENLRLKSEDEEWHQSCELLLDEMDNCQSTLNKKTGMYERIEDHDKQMLNGINAKEAADSLQRECFDSVFYEYKRERYITEEGKQKYNIQTM